MSKLEQTSISIKVQSEDTIPLSRELEKLKGEMARMELENQKQKDRVYNLEHLLKRKTELYTYENRQNKALREREENYHRQILKLKRGKLNPELKQGLSEIEVQENKKKESSARTIKELQSKVVGLEHQLFYMQKLRESTSKANSKKESLGEKEMRDKNLELVEQNLALNFQVQKLEKEIARQRQMFEAQSKQNEEKLNALMEEHEEEKNPKMFLMSSDLTKVLTSETANEENQGCLVSETNAKIFKFLDSFCKKLTTAKKMTFLSSLSTFAEMNIQKIVDSYEVDVFEEPSEDMIPDLDC